MFEKFVNKIAVTQTQYKLCSIAHQPQNFMIQISLKYDYVYSPELANKTQITN